MTVAERPPHAAMRAGQPQALTATARRPHAAARHLDPQEDRP
jgi:hypothetical protein